MDFLDPKKQKAHAVRLTIGYALMGIALLLATTVLLYRAYGYGLDKDGHVIQNGLVFVSSQPTGGTVYVNGKQYKNQTNTRLSPPGGQYVFEIKRDGYRSWKRAITVEGGSVGRFDYPVLFPSKLTTTVTKQYSAAPLLATQSLDRRWLIVQNAAPDQFDIYDLNTAKPVAKPLAMPSEILTPAATTQAWETVAWAGDNRHVVLKRTYQKDSQSNKEYILFDRQDPAQSRNLSILVGFSPTVLQLRDQKFDQYYLFDQGSGQLFTASVKDPTPKPYLSDVLGFDSYEDTVLYATTAGAPTGKVHIRLQQGDTNHLIRQAPAGTTYLMKLALYKDKWFVAAGSQAENRVYVYKNPADVLGDDPKAVLVPAQILKVDAPTYLTVSPNSRFFVAENADRFAVYDTDTDKGYGYQTKLPLDAPQTHATWMDGYHLQFVSGGTLQVFDFDSANAQALSPTNAATIPFYSRDNQFVYTFNAQHALTSTALVLPDDRDGF